METSSGPSLCFAGGGESFRGAGAVACGGANDCASRVVEDGGWLAGVWVCCPNSMAPPKSTARVHTVDVSNFMPISLIHYMYGSSRIGHPCVLLCTTDRTTPSLPDQEREGTREGLS